MLDNDDATRRVCLSPPLLAAVAHGFAGRFFLKDVQGRDPSLGGGYQTLHRDWPYDGPGARMIVGLAFLDRYDAANGATRLIPGTHNESGEMNEYSDFPTHPREIVVAGDPGDVLVFHGRLAHSGQRNLSGAPRRTLQICWQCHSTIGGFQDKRDLSTTPALDRYFMGAD